MALLSQLKPKAGARHRNKRIGCGRGSGHGGSATRGTKGQRSRSGDGKLVGFEGGQTPLLRRIPKRGFNNKPFSRRFEIVNLEALERSFEPDSSVDPQALRRQALVRREGPVKILGNGKLTKPLKVMAHAFSAKAKEAIEKAGGTATLLAREAAPAAKEKG